MRLCLNLPAVLVGEEPLLAGRVHVGPQRPLRVRGGLVLKGAQLYLVQPASKEQIQWRYIVYLIFLYYIIKKMSSLGFF